MTDDWQQVKRTKLWSHPVRAGLLVGGRVSVNLGTGSSAEVEAETGAISA